MPATYYTRASFYFTKLLRNEDARNVWSEVLVRLIPKTNDQSDATCSKFRPISVLPMSLKLWDLILLQRMEKQMEAAGKKFGEEQFGFRRGYQALEAVFAVRSAIQKQNLFGHNVYVFQGDIEKAFDKVSFGAIQTALHKNGIRNGCTAASLRLLSRIRTKYWVQGMKSPSVGIERNAGTLQGLPSSPFLFNLVMQDVFSGLKEKWRRSNFGVKLDERYFTHVIYADDFILIAKMHHELQIMVDDVAKALVKVNLSLSADKSVWITNNVDTAGIKLNGQQIQPSCAREGLVFLGCVITPDGRTRACTDRKIRLAWRKVWALKEIWTRKHSNHTLLAKYVDATITGIVTHGAGALTPTKADLVAYKVAQNGIFRSVFQLRPKRHEDRAEFNKRSSAYIKHVLERAGVRRWHERVAEDIWRWAGHVYRMDDARMAKKLLLFENVEKQRIAKRRNRGVLRPGIGTEHRGRTVQWENILYDHGQDLGLYTAAPDRSRWSERGREFAKRVSVWAVPAREEMGRGRC